MKRAWWLAAAMAVVAAGCDMKSPAQKKKEEEEAKRKAAASNPSPIRPEPPEGDHVLVKAEGGAVAAVSAPAVGLVRVVRSGVITTSLLKYNGPNVNRVNVGANSAGGGCCTTSDPPEFQAMGGMFGLLRDAQVTPDSPPSDEPVVLDGDYKAPWQHVRKVLEMMSRANMTRLVFATAVEETAMRGIVAKLPAGWKLTEAPPAAAKQVEIAAKGKELELKVDGTAYKDVTSAVEALKKAGVMEVALHPADAKTPLWAVVRGVELSLALAPAGPVRFVMVDR